jgi:predicted  nucleic acid-binding Zn-ribbon protein
MDAADARIADGRPILPSYEELQRENADLKRQLAAAHEEIQGLRRTVDQLRQRVEELSRQIEQLRGASKRQAAPFRKHDEPPAGQIKWGKLNGKLNGTGVFNWSCIRYDGTGYLPSAILRI